MYVRDAQKLYGNYKGSEHRPKDFDTFWESGKKEVDALGLECELVPHEIFSKVADGFDLWFVGVGGARIHAQLIRPKNISGKIPVQFQFHGYHTNAGDWADKIGLAAEGTMVVALDVRGQGGLSDDTSHPHGMTLKGHIVRGIEDGPEGLFFRSVFLDIYQLVKIVSNFSNCDTDKLSVYGASQGGALALVCAALCPEIGDVYCLYPFLSDYREAFRLNVAESAYEELAYWFRFKDPAHVHEKEFFETLDYIDLQYLAPFVKANVFWGMGLADTVCPPKTQFAVYNNLQCAKEMVAYPEYGHEYIPGYGDLMREKMSAKED